MLVTVSLLLAAACLVPAAGKLLGHPKMRRSAAHFGIAWRRYQFIGMAELAAATGILLGLYWRPIGLAAAAGMTLLLLGALPPMDERATAPGSCCRSSPPSPSQRPTWRSPSETRPAMRPSSCTPS
jgi:DoxX-like family